MRALILLLVLASIQLSISGGSLSLLNAERRAMLMEHNSRRNSLTPQASDVLIMQWDFDLEALATSHANLCVYQKGGVDSVTGQTIGALASPSDPASLLKIWFDDQKAAYTAGDSAGSLDYTQIAWATTNRVGCGKATCTGFNNISGSADFWVCNYNSVGNLPGEKPYQIGNSCSGCPKSHDGCSQNLCSPGPPDLGDFGAMVFPTGDDGSANTSDATIPDRAYYIGGDCATGENVYVKVKAGFFSITYTFNAVVVIEIGTQIYYSAQLQVAPSSEGVFNNEFPHLFTCVDYDAPMTVYAYNCANATGQCGGEWGVPENQIPAFSITLNPWGNFEDSTDITLKATNDPRYLILNFYYGKRGSTSTGVIVGAIMIILCLLIAVAGGVYWWQKKQNIAYHKANSSGIDRV